MAAAAPPTDDTQAVLQHLLGTGQGTAAPRAAAPTDDTQAVLQHLLGAPPTAPPSPAAAPAASPAPAAPNQQSGVPVLPPVTEAPPGGPPPGGIGAPAAPIPSASAPPSPAAAGTPIRTKWEGTARQTYQNPALGAFPWESPAQAGKTQGLPDAPLATKNPTTTDWMRMIGTTLDSDVSPPGPAARAVQPPPRALAYKPLPEEQSLHSIDRQIDSLPAWAHKPNAAVPGGPVERIKAQQAQATVALGRQLPTLWKAWNAGEQSIQQRSRDLAAYYQDNKDNLDRGGGAAFQRARDALLRDAKLQEARRQQLEGYTRRQKELWKAHQDVPLHGGDQYPEEIAGQRPSTAGVLWGEASGFLDHLLGPIGASRRTAEQRLVNNMMLTGELPPPPEIPVSNPQARQTYIHAWGQVRDWAQNRATVLSRVGSSDPYALRDLQQEYGRFNPWQKKAADVAIKQVDAYMKARRDSGRGIGYVTDAGIMALSLMTGGAVGELARTGAEQAASRGLARLAEEGAATQGLRRMATRYLLERLPTLAAGAAHGGAFMGTQRLLTGAAQGEPVVPLLKGTTQAALEGMIFGGGTTAAGLPVGEALERAQIHPLIRHAAQATAGVAATGGAQGGIEAGKALAGGQGARGAASAGRAGLTAGAEMGGFFELLHAFQQGPHALERTPDYTAQQAEHQANEAALAARRNGASEMEAAAVRQAVQEIGTARPGDRHALFARHASALSVLLRGSAAGEGRLAPRDLRPGMEIIHPASGQRLRVGERLDRPNSPYHGHQRVRVIDPGTGPIPKGAATVLPPEALSQHYRDTGRSVQPPAKAVEPETPAAAVPAPPPSPVPTPGVPNEPRLTLADGTSISLRHATPEALEQIAQHAEANGHPEIAARARQWLAQHEAHYLHQRPYYSQEEGAGLRNHYHDPSNTPMAVARQLTHAATQVEATDPDLAQKLKDGAAHAEGDSRRAFRAPRDRKLPEEDKTPLHPAASPPQASAWRRMTPEQRGALPEAVQRTLLTQDISNSLQVQDATHPGIHRPADVPGRPKSLKALEQTADRLFDSAQETLAARHPEPPLGGAPLLSPVAETAGAPVQTAPEAAPAPVAESQPAAPGASLTPEPAPVESPSETVVSATEPAPAEGRGPTGLAATKLPNGVPVVTDPVLWPDLQSHPAVADYLHEHAPAFKAALDRILERVLTPEQEARIEESGVALLGAHGKSIGGVHFGDQADPEAGHRFYVSPFRRAEVIQGNTYRGEPIGGEDAQGIAHQTVRTMLHEAAHANVKAEGPALWDEMDRMANLPGVGAAIEQAVQEIHHAISGGEGNSLSTGYRAGRDAYLEIVRRHTGPSGDRGVSVTAGGGPAENEAGGVPAPPGGANADRGAAAGGVTAPETPHHELTKAEFIARYGPPPGVTGMEVWPHQGLAPVAAKGEPGLRLEQQTPAGPSSYERYMKAFVERGPDGAARGTLAFYETVMPDGSKRASGIEIYVDPQHRGQGIATRLDAALTEAGYQKERIGGPARDFTPEGAALAHSVEVRQALARGEPVPDRVLADYPKIAAQYARREPIDAATGLRDKEAWASEPRGKVVAALRVSHPQAPVESLLPAAGEALRQSGLGERAYHLGGGELRVTGDDSKTVTQGLAHARALLAAHAVVSDQEGRSPEGIRLDYGIGRSEGAAQGKLDREPAAAGGTAGAAEAVQPAGAGRAGRERGDESPAAVSTAPGGTGPAGAAGAGSAGAGAGAGEAGAAAGGGVHAAPTPARGANGGVEAAPEAKPAKKQATGKTKKAAGGVGTETEVKAGGQTVAAQWAVVDIGSLSTSHGDNLAVNPAYPADLQPRDRTRMASKDQLAEMERKLDPALLGENPLAQHGAPIVGKDGVVESGNARTIALRRAYAKGGEAAVRYGAWLRQNAEQFGLTTAQIDSAARPILVRVRQGELTPAERIAFAAAANARETATLSATEQAKIDAGRVGPLMSRFAPGADGNMNTAGNRQFVRQFVAGLPEAERGGAQAADGSLSQEGLRRLQAAVFAHVYGDTGALARMAEATDEPTKNITNGLLRAAGEIAGLKGGQHDVAADIGAAADKLAALRESEMPVADYLAQQQLFGADLSPFQREVLERLHEFRRSGKKVAALLAGYAGRVQALGDPATTSMFDDVPPPTKHEVWATAARAVREGTNEPSLFEQAGAGAAGAAGGGGKTEETGPRPGVSPAAAGGVGGGPAGAGEAKNVKPVDLSKGNVQFDGFANPEYEAWRQENARPIIPPKPESLLTRLGHQATRSFEHLPDDAYHAPLANRLKFLENIRSSAGLKANLRIAEAIRTLNPEEYALFSTWILHANFAENAVKGTPNPPRIEAQGPQALADEGTSLLSQLAANPKVQDAVVRWRKNLDQLSADYAASKVAIGQAAPGFTKEDWYHQEFLAPAMEEMRQGAPTSRSKLKAVLHPDFTLRREGGVDFHADPVSAHLNALTDMAAATEKNKAIRLLQTPEEKGGYNAMPRHKAQLALGSDPVSRQWFTDLEGANNAPVIVRAIPNRVGQMAATGMLPDDGNGQWAHVIQSLAENWALNEQAKALGQPAIDLDPAVIGPARDYARWIREIYTAPPGGGKAPGERLPAGYARYRFTEDHPFYRAHSIPEQMAQELINGIVSELTIGQDDLRQKLIVGRRPDPLLLKEGIARTLEDLKPQRTNLLTQIIKQVVGGGKAVSVLNIEHAPTLGKEHLLKGILATARGNPRLVAEIGPAFADMVRARVKKRLPTPEYENFLYAGGAREFRTAVGDVGEEAALNYLAKFAPKGVTTATPGGSGTVTVTLEQRRDAERFLQLAGKLVLAGRIPVTRLDELFRYAAFRQFGKEIDSAGGAIRYGAARPDLADAIGKWNGRDALAHYLSDQLMGPYGDMPILLRQVRDKLPSAYLSFLFGAAKTEHGLAANNIWRQPAIRRAVLQRLGTGTGPEGRLASGLTATEGAVRYMWPLLLLSGLLYANNRLRAGKQEDEMGQQQPHLDLGRFPDGRMMVWDRVGALPGLASLLGLDDAWGMTRDLANGNMTLHQAARRIGTTGAQDLVAMSGQAKMLWEVPAGKRIGGGPIRNWPEYLLERTRLTELWHLALSLRGQPDPRAPWQERTGALALGARLVDPADEAYRQAVQDSRAWIQSQKGIDGGVRENAPWTSMEAAVYGYRRSLQARDGASAEKYVAAIAQARLAQMAASSKDLSPDSPITEALTRMDPLAGMPATQIPRYLKTLSPRQQVQLRSALWHWQQMAAPGLNTTAARREADLGRFITAIRQPALAEIQRRSPVSTWVRKNPATIRTAADAARTAAVRAGRWQQGLAPAGK